MSFTGLLEKNKNYLKNKDPLNSDTLNTVEQRNCTDGMMLHLYLAHTTSLKEIIEL